jgi:hypothetical protein
MQKTPKLPKTRQTVDSRLVAGLKEEDAAKFKGYFISALDIREKIVSIAKKEIAFLEHTKLEDYDKGSWAYYQADKNGELRTWKEIIKLMTVNEREY